MFCKLIVSLVWYYTIMLHNIMEISTNPIGLQILSSPDVGYQIVNTTNYLLADQGFNLVENQNSKRNRRWLEELYSYFYDSSEEDSSSEEEEKVNKNKEYGLCHNCNVTYNQVSQIQHFNHMVSQTSQSLPAVNGPTTTLKPKSQESNDDKKIYEMTSPNKIPQMNGQQVAPSKIPPMIGEEVPPIMQKPEEAVIITTTETAKEIDGTKQELTPPTAATPAPAVDTVEPSTSKTNLAEPTNTAAPTNMAESTNMAAPPIETTAETTEASLDK